MTTLCPACSADIAVSTALLACFLGLLVGAAVSDVRTMTIPNGISLVMACLYPVFALAAGSDWLDGLLAAAIVFGVGLAMFAMGWLGGGDVKLLAAISLWAGTALLLPALFITALAGGVLCAFLWVRHGGPSRILRRLIGDAPTAPASGSADAASVQRATVIPYAVAILAGGIFVAIAQFMPIWRLAETAS